MSNLVEILCILGILCFLLNDLGKKVKSFFFTIKIEISLIQYRNFIIFEHIYTRNNPSMFRILKIRI